MDKVFTVLPTNRNTPFNTDRWACFKKALLMLVVVSGCFTARAQQATFIETFDDTPLGEIPEGWNRYSFGGDRGNNWVRLTYGRFGPKVMDSGVEYSLPGELDEDWLITPQITPGPGDKLIFDSGQEYVWFDYGSTYKVLISTTTSSRDAFTETLAAYSEPEFPGYLYETPLVLDLSAYEGTPIYIAFVHENPVLAGDDPGNPPPTENWYLDNVAVRPLQPMDYVAGEINWSYDNVIRVAQSHTSVIIGIVIRTAGDEGTANLSSVTFTTEGSTAGATIKEAKLYTTYGDAFISNDEDSVWADVFGSIADPAVEFTIEGNQDLERGDTYFWLVYTLEADEGDLVYPYPQVDATFESVVVNGTERDATLRTATGSHSVVPPTPINDNYANAITINPSSMPTRYGSYNNKATFEIEFEKLAYCAEPVMTWAKDGSNSVWWYFKAPAQGRITVDLSACNFNTLLLIQDANYDQLACNKDIDEAGHIFQSKITDFEVSMGQELYIRVSGEGEGPGDPNAANGVIHMDFSFVTPVGTEEPVPYELSAVYPNPASGIAYVDVVLHKPAEVVMEVFDLMGRPVLTQDAGRMQPGTYNKLEMNVSSLPAGPYMVRLRGSRANHARKLMVMKNDPLTP